MSNSITTGSTMAIFQMMQQRALASQEEASNTEQNTNANTFTAELKAASTAETFGATESSALPVAEPQTVEVDKTQQSYDMLMNMYARNAAKPGYTDQIPKYDPAAGSTDLIEVDKKQQSYDMLMNIFAKARIKNAEEA